MAELEDSNGTTALVVREEVFGAGEREGHGEHALTVHAERAGEEYTRPPHSALIAVVFNVALVVACLGNLATAPLIYSIASDGLELEPFYSALMARGATATMIVAAGFAAWNLLVTGIAYLASLDHRRRSRPWKRVYLLATTFFLFLAAAALGSMKLPYEMWWAWTGAGAAALILPAAIRPLEYLAAKWLAASASGLLRANSPGAARSAARAGLRLTPGNRELEQAYGIALVRCGRGATALPYLLRTSADIDRQPPAVLAMLVKIFEEKGDKQHALEALEAQYRLEPATPTFDRILRYWLELGRQEEVLQKLQALSPTDRVRWYPQLRQLLFARGHLEECRAFCREVAQNERPPFTLAQECYNQLLEAHPHDLQTHRELIDLGQRSGNASRSAELLERLIDMNPVTAPEDRRKLITYYWTRGDREAMLRHLRALHTGSAATADEKLRLLEELFAQSHFEDAEQIVRADSELSRNVRALATLAHAQHERGAEDDALRTIDRVEELAVDSAETQSVAELKSRILGGRASARVEQVRSQVQREPQNVELRLKLASLLLESGDAAGAVETLREAATLPGAPRGVVLAAAMQSAQSHPANRELLHFVAETAADAGEVDTAFDHYQKAAALGGGDENLLHAGCERIVQANPNHKQSLVAEAKYWAARGDSERALHYLDRLQAAGGEADESLLQIEMESAVATGNLGRAEAAGKRLLGSAGGDPELLVRMSEIAADLQHFEEAETYLTSARDATGDADTYDRRLRELDKRRRRARVEELREVIARNEATADHYDSLGDEHFALNDLNEAMTAYQRVLEQEPERHVARAKLARAFAVKGLFTDADETLQAADLRPGMPPHDAAQLKELFYRCGQLMDQSAHYGMALNAFRRILRVEAGYRDVVDQVERLQRQSRKQIAG